MAQLIRDSQRELAIYLQTMKAMRESMGDTTAFYYKGMEHFLLEAGRWYEPLPWMGGYHQGAPKQCFGNAMILGAMSGLRYVEGIAIAGNVAFPFHHAWNLDADGRLIDNTWLNTGVAYIGVEFSLGRADDAIWNGDASVLDDYRRGHALYRQQWHGEDFALEWTPSEGMKMARRCFAEMDAANEGGMSSSTVED